MNREWFETGPYTFFDVETTGMSPSRDRIVEIAAIRFGADGSEDRLCSLVNPGRIFQGGGFSVHGIGPEMLADAPPFSEIGPKFLDFSAGSTLVAHNARFDLAFLQESLHRESLPLWTGPTLDTVRLVKTVFPDLPEYNLEYLAGRFGMEFRDGRSHRAMNDAEVTAQIFRLTMEKLLAHSRKPG